MENDQFLGIAKKVLEVGDRGFLTVGIAAGVGSPLPRIADTAIQVSRLKSGLDSSLREEDMPGAVLSLHMASLKLPEIGKLGRIRSAIDDALGPYRAAAICQACQEDRLDAAAEFVRSGSLKKYMARLVRDCHILEGNVDDGQGGPLTVAAAKRLGKLLSNAAYLAHLESGNSEGMRKARGAWTALEGKNGSVEKVMIDESQDGVPATLRKVGLSHSAILKSIQAILTKKAPYERELEMEARQSHEREDSR